MNLLIIIAIFIIIFVLTYLAINKKINKDTIKMYGHLATLGSVWSTIHGINEETPPWDPIFVKIINNKSYKKKQYITYMELDSGEQMTCELSQFLFYFTFRHE